MDNDREGKWKKVRRRRLNTEENKVTQASVVKINCTRSWKQNPSS